MSGSAARRRVLGVATTGAAALLAGCAAFGDDSPDPVGIEVANDDSADHGVTVTVTAPGGDVVVQTTQTVAAGSDSEVTEFVPRRPDEAETYTVTAEVIDGESESEPIRMGGGSGTLWATVRITEDGGVSIVRTVE